LKTKRAGWSRFGDSEGNDIVKETSGREETFTSIRIMEAGIRN
jgi:hypothetical protein